MTARNHKRQNTRARSPRARLFCSGWCAGIAARFWCASGPFFFL